jgi:hypothetical protein
MQAGPKITLCSWLDPRCFEGLPVRGCTSLGACVSRIFRHSAFNSGCAISLAMSLRKQVDVCLECPLIYDGLVQLGSSKHLLLQILVHLPQHKTSFYTCFITMIAPFQRVNEYSPRSCKNWCDRSLGLCLFSSSKLCTSQAPFHAKVRLSWSRLLCKYLFRGRQVCTGLQGSCSEVFGEGYDELRSEFMLHLSCCRLEPIINL